MHGGDRGIMTDTNAIRVICIYCNTEIVLNEDSEATRNAGTDPNQQLRRHLFEKHLLSELDKHYRNTSWLIDMLAFRSVLDETRWRTSIDRLVTYYLQGPIPISTITPRSRFRFGSCDEVT